MNAMMFMFPSNLGVLNWACVKCEVGTVGYHALTPIDSVQKFEANNCQPQLVNIISIQTPAA